MKRTLSLLLTAVIILTLCACGAPAKSEAPAAEPAPTAVQPEAVPAETQAPVQETDEPVPTETPDPIATPEVTEAPAEETPDADESDEIRPEFKAMMDSYEEFFNDYAELMSALAKNPGDMSLLMKSLEFMDKYTKMLAELDEIDTGELSTAELSYYIEVTARIEKTLLSVIG